jgi:heme-degrading monooxygenase HmoA
MMFAVLYHWKLKPGAEASFREAWRSMTEAIVVRSGTGGSRLHRTDDDHFVAYAVWPSRQAWEDAGKLPSADPAAGAKMRDCIEESLATTALYLVDDLLRELPR